MGIGGRLSLLNGELEMRNIRTEINGLKFLEGRLKMIMVLDYFVSIKKL